jgi:hypothetical protein
LYSKVDETVQSANTVTSTSSPIDSEQPFW